MKITAVVSLACRLVPTYTIAESSAGLRGRRAFSHSAPVRDSDRSIADPTYPDLHYHPNSSPPDTTTPYFALSFLSALPVSRTLLIGWTPARATNSAPILSPTTFFENEPFVELLHDVVRENVGEGDEPMKAAAEWQKEGWLHVAACRTKPRCFPLMPIFTPKTRAILLPLAVSLTPRTSSAAFSSKPAASIGQPTSAIPHTVLSPPTACFASAIRYILHS
ncbi:hypothetical protein BC937DRAFT_86913 [Endogone sp. FLAS-F59071]|nr:hypothetical protein BC937DRAFT_86913 [Endogone sp. FLAS-F59071]|eukprot:RUS19789.1 hypothetical protein BC937DRAFT_86913 [Endogone sp. FLAS-F59071]